MGERRVYCVLPCAFGENPSEMSEESESLGQPRVSEPPTGNASVGDVGDENDISPVASDTSDTAPERRRTEKSNEINDVPTPPTPPTDSDSKHSGENDSDPNGAADDQALTCAHCGAAFLRKPGPGRPAKYCSPECRRAALAARTKGYDPDESGDVVFDA